MTCHLPVSDVDHPLSVGVSEVALVGWSEMDFGLVQRIRDAIWENARRQTRDHFGHSELVCVMEYVVINEHVVSQERMLWSSITQGSVGDRPTSVAYLELHVIVQATDCHPTLQSATHTKRESTTYRARRDE